MYRYERCNAEAEYSTIIFLTVVLILFYRCGWIDTTEILTNKSFKQVEPRQGVFNAFHMRRSTRTDENRKMIELVFG